MNDRPQSKDEALDWRLELERRVPVSEAARMKGISEDTFRRRYSHLIDQVSDRRQAVKLKHVID
jgi:hypothetical protein